MRIVQITDLHVGQEGQETQGVDVRANFLKVRDAVRSLNPDHLVISGDLCFDNAEKPVYNWIKPHLDTLDIPYDIISGNHDDSVLLAQAFGLEDFLNQQELFFHKRLGNKEVLFMDTSIGEVSSTQMEWLKGKLKQLEQDIVIFMHHPPLYAGVPFMDINHSLRNKKDIQDILFAYPHQVTIFTGHYHVEKTICKKNVVVHITPSCFFQIDQHSEGFKVDHHRIGLREIFYEDGTIMSTVRYL